MGLLLMLLRSFVDSKYQQRSAGYTCQHSQAAKGSELSSAASAITMTSQPSIRQASLITKTANARLSLKIKVKDSDFRFSFQIKISASDFRFRFQIQISDSDFGFRFHFQISDSGFRFRFQVQIPDSDSDF